MDEARRHGAEPQRQRAAQEAAYQFMLAMGGDLPGYEEATRALFAADLARLQQCIETGRRTSVPMPCAWPGRNRRGWLVSRGPGVLCSLPVNNDALPILECL